MKKLMLLCLVAFMAFTANAQPPIGARGNRPGKEGRGAIKEKIEMYKVQFMTEKLALTAAEAEQFWPVYEAQKKAMKDILETKSGDEIQMQEAILNARKKYKADLKPVLKTDERVNEALKADREFLKKMRSEINRRKGFRA
jgi:Spy/CpxP family protein refolding chaperone